MLFLLPLTSYVSLDVIELQLYLLLSNPISDVTSHDWSIKVCKLPLWLMTNFKLQQRFTTPNPLTWVIGASKIRDVFDLYNITLVLWFSPINLRYWKNFLSYYIPIVNCEILLALEEHSLSISCQLGAFCIILWCFKGSKASRNSLIL